MTSVKKHAGKIITAILLIAIFILCLYNFCNNPDFLEASATALITIAVAIIFSYWLTQIKSDKRKRNEKIDKLLYKIQEIVGNPDFISAETPEVCRKNLISHRSVVNKINCIKIACEEDKRITDKVLQLEDEFKRFREFYGDHYAQKEYMKNSDKDLINYIAKIDDKADEIHIMLL